MNVNISQLNTQKVSPWGPMAATAKEQEGEHRWHQERAKRATRTHNTQGGNSLCCSICQDDAVGNGWQSGHERIGVHHSGHSQEGRGEGHATNYFPHAEIEKPEAFYKNQSRSDKNNTVQQMNSIQFLK